jgi:putative transposase
MHTINEIAPRLSVSPTCAAFGIPRASYYRWLEPKREHPPRRSGRALSDEERQAILDVLHEERFVDLPPAQVWARLMDQGRYLCSIRTMHRVLAAANESKERRAVRRHPNHAVPELVATRPNEVWSWDITKLPGPAAWTSFYLYVILDIFSRYVVGWLAAGRESKVLARRLIATTLERQGIRAGELTLHSDRGGPMVSKPVAFLLADLGVTKSHSRPRVSNDNPFSESHFKTMKYRPETPTRFASVGEVCSVFGDLFGWYNHEHRHSGLGLLTPHEVHHGLAESRIAARAAVLARAYAEHPERFVRGFPRPPAPPREVWINKPPAGVASLILAPGACGTKTDLATASRTNDLEVGRGTGLPPNERRSWPRLLSKLTT